MGEEKEGATYSSSQASAPEQGMPQRWEQGHRLASSNPSRPPSYPEQATHGQARLLFAL